MRLISIKTSDGRDFRASGDAAEKEFQNLAVFGFSKTDISRDYILVDHSLNEIQQTILINKAHIVSVTLTEEN